jgi:HK97 gp10 family phage protein
MFSMRMEGGDQLAAALAQLSTRLSKSILRDALLDGGEPMRALVARNAPRAPGAPDMADHVVIAAVRDRENQASVGIGMDSKEFFYDLFVERGTSRMKARPFYRPAFDEKVPEAIDLIGQELWRQLTARGLGFRAASAPSSVSGPGSVI